MIYLDPRYSNYWLDQAREEEKKKQKDKKKKEDQKNNLVYSLVDLFLQKNKP